MIGQTGYCVDFEPSVGVGMPQRAGVMGIVRDPTYMSLNNNVRSVTDCNSQPIGNPARPGQAVGNPLSNFYVNYTDRGEINPQMVLQTGIRGDPRWNNLSFRDQAKTTMKETTQYNYQGNPERQEQGSNWYRFEDNPKTTMKETLQFNYQGNPERENQGSNWYRYDDNPKTTMKETTQYNYQGNPERAEQGSTFYTYQDKLRPTIKQSTQFSYTGIANPDNKQNKFYTYSDKPKPTIKQSTQFSYAGNLGRDGGASSRTQYTGLENQPVTELIRQGIFPQGLRVAGADTYTIKGATLVENYFPGAGRLSIRQNPDQIIGKIDFGTFGSDQNYTGPGTLTQAIPNGSAYQNNRFLAEPSANPNKLFGMDDRQIAGFQVQQLKNNPLSIFTSNPSDEIPKFFENSAPDDYSTLIQDRDDEINEILKSQPKPPKNSVGGIGGMIPNNVYPPNGNVNNFEKDNNPNKELVYNLSLNYEGDFNPLIAQGSSRAINNDPVFSGKAYSGQFGSVSLSNPNYPTTLGGENPSKVYGPTNGTYHKKQLGEIGIEAQRYGKNVSEVCKPNPALDFAGGTLMLNNVS